VVSTTSPAVVDGAVLRGVQEQAGAIVRDLGAVLFIEAVGLHACLGPTGEARLASSPSSIGRCCRLPGAAMVVVWDGCGSGSPGGRGER
jgi:hypothetical protein